MPMAKQGKKAATEGSGANEAALSRRYGSIAEIKREFFPNAAAEDDAAATMGAGENAYENLMDEFFGPQKSKLEA
jgi:hypothetical protein